MLFSFASSPARGRGLRRGLGERGWGRGDALQRQLDQQLGIGARNQRRRRHFEIQPEELALAQDIGEGFPAQALLEQRGVMLLLFSVEDMIGMGEQPGAIHLQHGLQQALHLDARAAGIQPERGFQRSFIVSQERLDGVRHRLEAGVGSTCCLRTSVKASGASLQPFLLQHFSTTLFGGAAYPFHRLQIVVVNALSLEVHHAKVVLRLRVPLFCGLAIP